LSANAKRAAMHELENAKLLDLCRAA